ncbi:MAG: PilZ domain-containing protein [Eubacteriales bacterium]
MLKLLFCKVADVFDRERQFLFTASVIIQPSGEAELRFPTDVPIEEMEIEGYVTFYDDVEGLVTYFCNFYELKRESKEISMFISAADMVDQVQRRQDLKTSVRFKMEIDYMDLRGKMRFCQAEVENISAGGVFFTSEHKFSLGDSVVLRLSEISPRLFTETHILRIQALDDWESSPWLIRADPPPLPPKPPAPEGQNIFSFVKKRKEMEKNAIKLPEPSEEEAPVAPTPTEEEIAILTRERDVEADLGGDTLRYGYGCQFRQIGQGKEIAIRRFVFEQERLRLQSKRQ